MCDYPFFIPQVVLFANSSLFWFKVTNEHREFRNYLFKSYLCKNRNGNYGLRYRLLFSIYQTSKPASIIHAIIADTNQWFENKGKNPFTRKMIPFKVMIPPILRQRGTIRSLSFSFCGIFFHRERWR